jgi:hypothetical protein
MYSLQRRTAARNSSSVRFFAAQFSGNFVGDRRGQPGMQMFQALVCRAPCARLARIRIHDQVELAEDVVHHRELVRQQQQHVGRADCVRLGRAGRRIDGA